MIAYLEGKVLSIHEEHVVVFVGGIGYKVYTPKDTLLQIVEGTNISLSTYLVVREDALDLYGFVSMYEKEIFTLLLSVSGIGPRSALGVLKAIQAETLVRAISTGDTKTLSAISGIGKKTAEKIVIELKDKIIKQGKFDGRELKGASEVMLALEALGYRQSEIRECLRDIDESLDTQGKIKEALKHLHK